MRLDDNYLDQIFTKMSAEHRDLLMSTAKRLNLPDDDALFVFIGAAEYILQLTQNVLLSIESQNISFEEASVKSITDFSAIGKVIVADIKNIGSANISAITQANQESMKDSKAIADKFEVLATKINTAFSNLKTLSDQRETALIESVQSILVTAHQANKNTEDLTKKLSQATHDMNVSAQNIEYAAKQIKNVRNDVTWEKWFEWLSPSWGLLVCFFLGGCVGAFVMNVRQDAERKESFYVWGQYLWNRNSKDIQTCLNNGTKICKLRVQDE